MISVNAALKRVKQVLGQKDGHEAELLVQAVLRQSSEKPISRAELYLGLDACLSLAQEERLMQMATQRAQGMPLQHLTGVQVFLEHEYGVGPEVLVPRPETEVLVTEAINRLEQGRAPPRLGVEVGVGSGIISIELLCRFSTLKMVASDVSAVALACAKQNAENILGAGWERRLTLLHSSSADAVFPVFEEALCGRKADFLISNPPYLAADDSIEASVLQFEPAPALFPASTDPLFFYREFAKKSRTFLAGGDSIFLEVPHQRAGTIAALFRENAWEVERLQDMSGRDRMLVGR